MQNHMTLSTDRVDHVNGAWTTTVGGNECVYEYENDHNNNNNDCFISDSATDSPSSLPPLFPVLKYSNTGCSFFHSFVPLVTLTQCHYSVISYQIKTRDFIPEKKKRHNLLSFQAKLLWQWKMVSSLEYCQTKELLIKVHTRPCGV